MAGILADIQLVLKALKFIYSVGKSIEGNKERCRFLVDRCRSFEEPIRSLESKAETMGLHSNLKSLANTISACTDFLEKYGRGGWKRYCLNATSTFSIKEKFMELNDRLTHASNDMHFGFTIMADELHNVNEQDEDALNIMISEMKEILIESNYKADYNIHLQIANHAEDLMKFDALLALVHNIEDIVKKSNSNTSPNSSKTTEPNMSASVSSSSKSNKDKASKSLIFSTVDLSLLEWDKSTSAKLGKGSFATVYHCIYDGQAYALKHFENVEALTDKELYAIQREARVMQLTKHVNIVGFVGFCAKSGVILSELASGSLHDILHRSLELNEISELTTAVKIKWFLGIARALRYLHFHGIIHRDIKPQNILLVRASNGEILAKVSDFGISVAVGMSTWGSTVQSKGAAGSTCYMAPELIDFDDIPIYTTAVDIYAFGILMNETMCETVPWEGLKVRQIESSVSKGKRPKSFIAETESEGRILALIGDAEEGCLCTEISQRPIAGSLCTSLESICGLDKTQIQASDKMLSVKENSIQLLSFDDIVSSETATTTHCSDLSSLASAFMTCSTNQIDSASSTSSSVQRREPYDSLNLLDVNYSIASLSANMVVENESVKGANATSQLSPASVPVFGNVSYTDTIPLPITTSLKQTSAEREFAAWQMKQASPPAPIVDTQWVPHAVVIAVNTIQSPTVTQPQPTAVPQANVTVTPPTDAEIEFAEWERKQALLSRTELSDAHNDAAGTVQVNEGMSSRDSNGQSSRTSTSTPRIRAADAGKDYKAILQTGGATSSIPPSSNQQPLPNVSALTPTNKSTALQQMRDKYTIQQPQAQQSQLQAQQASQAQRPQAQHPTQSNVSVSREQPPAVRIDPNVKEGEIMTRFGSIFSKDWHNSYYVLRDDVLNLYASRSDYSSGRGVPKKIAITHELKLLKIESKEYKGHGTVYSFMLEDFGKFGSTHRSTTETFYELLKSAVLQKRWEKANPRK